MSADTALDQDLFAVLLIFVQFLPILVNFISSLIAWHEADKAAEKSPAELDSPTSPLADGAPPQEETKPDVEQPKTFRNDEELPNLK